MRSHRESYGWNIQFLERGELLYARYGVRRMSANGSNGEPDDPDVAQTFVGCMR